MAIENRDFYTFFVHHLFVFALSLQVNMARNCLYSVSIEHLSQQNIYLSRTPIYYYSTDSTDNSFKPFLNVSLRLTINK